MGGWECGSAWGVVGGWGVWLGGWGVLCGWRLSVLCGVMCGLERDV